MQSQAKILHLSVDEYLQFEIESITRHEYIAGQVYSIVAGSDRTKIITENILTRLRTHLLGTDLRVYSSEMKLRIEQLNIFYYPEISVTCNSQDRDRLFKKHPCLIVEILSPSKERISRNEKLMNYRHLESLQEYVLVSQSEIKIEIYRKYNPKNWFLETLTEADTVKLSSVNLEMTMAEIYEDVEL